MLSETFTHHAVMSSIFIFNMGNPIDSSPSSSMAGTIPALSFDEIQNGKVGCALMCDRDSLQPLFSYLSWRL